MKNLIRIPLIMAISVLCCRSGRAQEFYRGEMFVTGQQFSLADGRLNIDLSVDFEGLRMPSDESLTVTPVLISGENEQALPAVLINGTEKQKVYQRQQEFTGNGHPSPIPAVVIRNDARMARSFRYRVAVPYQEWMKDALLLIRSQECACHGRQGSIYEDKIADRLNLPKVRTSVWDTDTDRKYLTWVNFIEPAPDKDTLHAVTGSIPYFGKEQRDKRERPLGELSVTKQNFEIYHRMRNALQDIRREAGTKLVKVKITGYGAPVGNLQKNEVDALVRSLKLKDYLRENRLTAGTPLEVTWISEDWDSIAALVKQSDMMFREATLDLIGNVDIDKGRERMLMHLADGKPYKYLAEKENIPLIDLHAMTRILYEAMGVEESKHAFVHYPANTYPGQDKPLADNTHFNPYGAYQIAKCVIEEMKQAGLPLVKYLRTDNEGYNPGCPDARETFKWNESPFTELEKPDGN